jgi:hypothetical protein
MKAIERRALQSEAMGLFLGAALRLRSGQALQTESVERTPEKKRERRAEYRRRIETFRLCASLLQAHLPIDTRVIGAPLIVNNAG